MSHFNCISQIFKKQDRIKASASLQLSWIMMSEDIRKYI